MVRLCALVSFLALIASCGGTPAPVRVHFVPNGGIAKEVCDEISVARDDIHVAIYAFTREDICLALLEAHRRGVTIHIKLDRRNAGAANGAWKHLRRNGIAVEFSTIDGSMHHKYCVIDGRRVLTGSYNWINSAEERNHENLVVIEDPAIARRYVADWEAIPADGHEPVSAKLESREAKIGLN